MRRVLRGILQWYIPLAADFCLTTERRLHVALEVPNANTKTPLDEFMLTEYSNLAQAFFNAGTGITQFFQYYLLAMGVPLTVAGIVLKVSSDTLDPAKVVQSATAVPLGIFFLLGGLVGVCMALYITNLRLDA